MANQPQRRTFGRHVLFGNYRHLAQVVGLLTLLLPRPLPHHDHTNSSYRYLLRCLVAWTEGRLHKSVGQDTTIQRRAAAWHWEGGMAGKLATRQQMALMAVSSAFLLQMTNAENLLFLNEK